MQTQRPVVWHTGRKYPVSGLGLHASGTSSHNKQPEEGKGLTRCAFGKGILPTRVGTRRALEVPHEKAYKTRGLFRREDLRSRHIQEWPSPTSLPLLVVRLPAWALTTSSAAAATDIAAVDGTRLRLASGGEHESTQARLVLGIGHSSSGASVEMSGTKRETSHAACGVQFHCLMPITRLHANGEEYPYNIYFSIKAFVYGSVPVTPTRRAARCCWRSSKRR